MKTFDIEVEGRGFYSITGGTDAGKAWIDERVFGSASGAACCDDTRLVYDIMDAALDEGLSVSANGQEYEGE